MDSQEKPQRSRSKAMIVDDVEINLVRIELGLKSLDLEYRRAYTGEEAIKASEEGEFAFILMDIFMPGMSGLEAVKLIRSDPQNPNSKTPVIFITAEENEGFNDEGYELGAIDFITKPVGMAHLRSKCSVLNELYSQKIEAGQLLQALEETQKQLIEREKREALSTFAGGLCHELNNKLTVLLGNVHYLEGNDDIKTDILEAGEMCKEILDSLIYLPQRFKNQSQTLVPLQDIGHRALSETEALSREGKIQSELHRIDFDCDKDLAETVVYERLTLDLLMPLVQNSIEAVKQEKKELANISLKIHPSEDQSLWHIRVTDHGPGVEPDLLPKLFDPFFSTVGIPERTGLGLTRVRHLVEGLGGEVTLSNIEGAGLEVSIDLPSGALTHS